MIGLIRADFGIEHKGRNLGQERDGGSDIKLGPWDVEVKRRRRIANLYEWLENADMVVLRGDSKPFLVVLPWTEFVRIAREEVK